MNEPIIKLKQDNCKDCYKCIRNCPVKAISFANNRAEIIPDECILCGRCFVVCPQNAKEIRSDIQKVQSAIRSGKKVIASVAPSFIAAFDVNGIEDFKRTLTALGFADARETAVGAEMVSREYERILAEGRHKALISSCCPSINTLIEKYYPDMLGHLAHVLTPMQAHCSMIKRECPDAFTVFIGPCISKKQEADEAASVDACLTYDEISEWMAEQGESPVSGASYQNDGEGQRARFYPTAGGIIKSLNKTSGYHRVAIDGVENCRSALEEIRSGRLSGAFIEMSACEGSCIAGPIIREHRQRRLSGALKVARYAGYSDYGVKPLEDMTMPLAPAGLKRVIPGNEAINQVLKKMGKTSPEKELNCGCCGYPTCRDKAIAVCQGKAEIEMCLPFLKEKAESFSDKIIANTPNAVLVMDEDLVVQQINSSAMRLFKLRSPDDILHAPVVRMLDPTDYLNVVTSGRGVVNKRHYIAEYRLFVEETILYDRQYKILISIMRDVTEQENARAQEEELRKQTIEVTDKVIDKQMRVVQEIASLLGETTAETKVALTKLKEAMKNE
ncbi:MAG: [Fe-Fe] hydrogenase large subunit C-terminal domain-containing protein [Clostridia bacterium]|nr:[Fe-Fe] hydrogenase large subunit C-terminal domain-containing protein [Clostridia bacterium]